MAKKDNKKERKRYLHLSLLINLGVLAFFKYSIFISENISGIATLLGLEIPIFYHKLLLPIGISFYTLQTLSYTFEVYKKRVTPEKDFTLFALYVSYFPQLVAGPIERPSNLLPQFKKKISFNVENIKEGSSIILWGFYKKLVIADRVGIYVDEVFNNPNKVSGIYILLATFGFAIQIYCDFSAYTDIAKGSARLLGHNLIKNFESPYFSRTFSEFWRRWHISLSSWFRDYVFITIIGKRITYANFMRAMFIVFITSGLWHGANMTFILWGFVHFLYIFLEKTLIFDKFYKVKNNVLYYILVQVLLVFSWIFFRANNMENLSTLLLNIVKPSHVSLDIMSNLVTFDIWFVTINLVTIFIFKFISLKKLELPKLFYRTKSYILLILILLFSTFERSDFIYFQF
jgi:D-alanyl-lipoteichoic acid acyltransferase DltB (MBOAT superfamily)